jgi:hypothetical protein
MRQHVLGPYPFDPNLIGQGIPPDDRTTFNENIYAPPEGTPMLPVQPVGPAEPAQEAPHLPASATLPGPSGSTPPATPNSLSPNADDVAPAAATVHYDRRTGRYIGDDGRTYTQSNLKTSADASTWQNLLPH